MSQISQQVITRIIELARHAPSSHNTQPWEVRIEADVITLGYAPNRQLKVGDPDLRELFLSLGAFIETVVCAGQDLGVSVNYEFVSSDPSCVARLTLATTGHKEKKWSKAIINRRTDRRLYQQTSLRNNLLQELKKIQFGTAKLYLFTKLDDIRFFARQTEIATLSVMENPAFRKELAMWVRHNWTKQPHGMPGYTQGMPGPLSLIAKFVIPKSKGVAKQQSKLDGQRVSASAAIGVVIIEENTPKEWIDAGRVYQSACLRSALQDVKTAGVTASLVVQETIANIKNEFKIKHTPVALIRFGYAKNTVRATPRYKFEQLLEIG